MLTLIIKAVARLAVLLTIIISQFSLSCRGQGLDTAKLVRSIERELKKQGLPNAKFELKVSSQNQSGGQTAFMITNYYGSNLHIVNGTNNGINGDVNFLMEKYSLVAKLNMYGLDAEYGFGFMEVQNGISLLMKKVVKYSDGKFNVIMTKAAEKCADSVIALFPYFPFAYWAKATYRLIENDPKGFEYAKMGIEILSHTTKIEGHHPIHDEALEQLTAWVKLEK